MTSKVLVALVAVAGVLVFGVAQGSAGRDPDSRSALAATALLPVQVDSALLALGDPLDEASLDYTSTVGVPDTAAGTDAAPADLSADPPSSSNLVVDDDKVQCPNAQYTMIQPAVMASGPNDTIKVCPGNYPEQVRIVGHTHDGLKLISVRPLQAVIRWPLVETPPLNLVSINQADRVKVAGFTITGPWTGGCAFPRHEGVSIEESFNDDIVGNHITEIRNSLFALRGCQEGDAVAIGMRNYPCGTATIPGSARVAFNWIDKYQKNGVQDVNPGSFADVDHNLITGEPASPTTAAPNGVVVCNAGARVHHNVINGNHYTPVLSTGIILSGAPSGSIVDHNRVYGNDYGIYADSESGVKISHNEVFDNFADAITICGEVPFCAAFTNSTVDGNDVENNDGSGILLNVADSNLVKSNRVEQNGSAAFGPDMTDGIRVDSGSTNNQIRENFMDDNITHDCHDDSVGLGTAGTANYWLNDRGETENRPGLCTRHDGDDDD